VNDIPSEMQHVIVILRELGVDVEVVTTTEDALASLRQDAYEVIVSDMRRGTSVDEGLKLLDRMRQDRINRPIIFTVGQNQPERGTPPYAFGITNRVDELLNLLFDAIERGRGLTHATPLARRCSERRHLAADAIDPPRGRRR